MGTYFSKISDIRVEAPSTWDNNIFLTFDIDWVCDEVLEDTIDLVEKADVAATWFVTHDSPLLERLRANPKFELGIHPNFNFLLEGNARNGRNIEEITDRLLSIVPGAKSVRSHSMTQNGPILQLFYDKGLVYDCNHFVPERSGIQLKPWRLCNRLMKVPHFWEDDDAFIYNDTVDIRALCRRRGIKVFTFHPIHVFLNTENTERHESTRPWHHDPEKLIKHQGDHPNGTRKLLKQLLEQAGEGDQKGNRQLKDTDTSYR